jgi:hypothetical protein
MPHESSSRLIMALTAFALSLAIGGAPGFGPDVAFAKGKPAAKDSKDKPKTEDAAQDDSGKKGKTDKTDKADKGDKSGKTDKARGGKPELLGSFADWGAYLAQGSKDKTCYALGQPKDRQPKAKLKDTSAYIFISTRPGEGVRNEVAINLGYGTKDGSAASAAIDGDEYELITKGANAWVKDQSKEKEFVGALRGGSKLVVKASSSKGTSTTDTYSLKGLSDALARVVQECK